MYHFWDAIIEPVLEKLRPSGMVEIGCDDGKNTRNLVEFCARHGATLYAIDPAPKFEVAAWEQQYREHFVFYQSLSLNAIPKVGRFEVVLIDGDHNWYTVFHELKLIEKRSQELGQPFPLVMFHDVGWPYARRDLYYNPETIPEPYRKPYAKKGIRPGSPELVDDGGLNPHLFNSIYEHNYQSGVLTAVEDFVRDTEEDLEFVYIPGHYGLGVLIPAQLKENQELTQLVNTFTLPVVAKHIERIEVSRVEEAIKKLDHQAALQAKEAEVSNLRGRVSESERVLVETQQQVAGVKGELEKAREQLEKTEAFRQELEAKVLNYEARLKEKEIALAELAEDKRQSEEEAAREIERLNQEVKSKDNWLQKVNKGVDALKESRRWKVGNALGRMWRILSFRKGTPLALDYITKTLSEYEAWAQGQSLSVSKDKALSEVTPEDVHRHQRWLEQLERDMNQLLQTRRLKIGNAIGFVSLILRGRGKAALPSDHMREIFLQFHNWSPQSGKEKSDIQKLSRWIEQLQHDYEVLIKSRRWKTGDKIVTSINRLFLRKRGSMATEPIESIFSNFKEWHERRRCSIDYIVKKDRIKNTAERRDLTIAVVAWDVGHNPLGRAYMLAEALQREFNVILLGFSFAKFGSMIWEPVRQGRIPVISIPGKNFPEFTRTLEQIARRIDVDAVIACKPRLPSVQLGLMIKQKKNCPLFIDIDH